MLRNRVVIEPQNCHPSVQKHKLGGVDESPDRFNQPEKAQEQEKTTSKHVDPLGSFDIPNDQQIEAEKAERQAQDDLRSWSMEPLDFDMNDGR